MRMGPKVQQRFRDVGESDSANLRLASLRSSTKSHFEF